MCVGGRASVVRGWDVEVVVWRVQSGHLGGLGGSTVGAKRRGAVCVRGGVRKAVEAIAAKGRKEGPRKQSYNRRVGGDVRERTEIAGVVEQRALDRDRRVRLSRSTHRANDALFGLWWVVKWRWEGDLCWWALKWR